MCVSSYVYKIEELFGDVDGVVWVVLLLVGDRNVVFTVVDRLVGLVCGFLIFFVK